MIEIGETGIFLSVISATWTQIIRKFRSIWPNRCFVDGDEHICVVALNVFMLFQLGTSTKLPPEVKVKVNFGGCERVCLFVRTSEFVCTFPVIRRTHTHTRYGQNNSHIRPHPPPTPYRNTHWKTSTLLWGFVSSNISNWKLYIFSRKNVDRFAFSKIKRFVVLYSKHTKGFINSLLFNQNTGISWSDSEIKLKIVDNIYFGVNLWIDF